MYIRCLNPSSWAMIKSCKQPCGWEWPYITGSDLERQISAVPMAIWNLLHYLALLNKVLQLFLYFLERL